MDGNPTLLKEMVRNLVDNAINYTPSSPDKPGVVTAKVLADTVWPCAAAAGGRLWPGHPEAERELVFQPFYRALGTRPTAQAWACPSCWKLRASTRALRARKAASRCSPLCSLTSWLSNGRPLASSNV
jgi:two-component system sensor histidine kinase TctE